MKAIWPQYGRNMAAIWPQYGGNMKMKRQDIIYWNALKQVEAEEKRLNFS